WIVPKFKKIFLDFDAELPAATEWLVSVGRYCEHYWWLFVPMLTLMIVLMLYPVARYFGWNPPGMGWITRRLDAADVLDGLSMVARQRTPMPDGLTALAQSTPRWNIRELLRRAAGDVENGRGWAESLFARGLIRRADLAVIRSAEQAGNLPWALGELAQSNRRRFAYRLQAAVQTAFPIVIIGFGMIVGFVVIALFMPLIQLITAMS
ncbi:MAG: type II secretion system F family protein, partial [Pirellulales bacterium]|nr:type II secretion system F family protein [Pirellulales bacterium]